MNIRDRVLANYDKLLGLLLAVITARMLILCALAVILLWHLNLLAFGLVSAALATSYTHSGMGGKVHGRLGACGLAPAWWSVFLTVICMPLAVRASALSATLAIAAGSLSLLAMLMADQMDEAEQYDLDLLYIRTQL